MLEKYDYISENFQKICNIFEEIPKKIKNYANNSFNFK